VVFGEEHVHYRGTEYTGWDNEGRPHQGAGNRPLSVVVSPGPVEAITAEQIGCEERLDGILKHYYRGAAA
jgi:hypothetical protein